MSFIYEDEKNDLGQANYEKSYGSRMEKWYLDNYDRASTEGYTPQQVAEDMYAKGKYVEPNEDFNTWAKRHNVNRFVESATLYDTRTRQQREDEQVRQHNLATKGDAMRGLSSGVDEMQGTLGGGGMMLMGKMVGNDNFIGEWLTKKGSEYYQGQMREASLNPTKQLISDKDGQWISDDIQGAGDLVDWAQGEFGKLLPSMALGLLSGGLGAVPQIGGRAVAAPIMRGFVDSQAKRLLAKGFVKATATKSAEEIATEMAKRHVGGRAGAWLGTAMLETSGSYADAVEHRRQQYIQQGMRPEDALLKASDDASGLLAMGTGLAAGGIEMMGGNIKILDKVLGTPAAKAADDLIRIARSSRATGPVIGRALNAAKQFFMTAVKAAPAEFAQEGAQELLNILNVDFADPEYNFFSADTLKQALAAGAAGAVGGMGAATGSHVFTSAKDGLSGGNKVKAEIDTLTKRIANQESYLKANPTKAAEIQASLEENRANLTKLSDYANVEENSVSYADAVKRIQAEAPHPDGKKFTTRALKKLIESENSPLALMKDSSGKPVEGAVDPATLDAHIKMRVPAADVAEEATTAAPLAAQVEAQPLEEGSELVVPAQMEDGRPEPPAQVEEEGVETFDPKDTVNRRIVPGRLGEIIAARTKSDGPQGERTFQNTLSLRGVDALEQQFEKDVAENEDPYAEEGRNMLKTVRRVATVLEKKLGRKAVEALEKSGVLSLDWAMSAHFSGEYNSANREATISPERGDEEIWSSALHEVGSHHGLENMIQKVAGEKGWENFRSMMTSAVDSDPILKEAYETTVADYIENAENDDLSDLKGLSAAEQMKNDIFLHEVAARVADYDSKLTGGRAKQAIMWIRDRVVQWLRKTFGAKIGMTAGEVSRLIRGSMNHVVKDSNRQIDASNLHAANLEVAMRRGLKSMSLKNVSGKKSEFPEATEILGKSTPRTTESTAGFEAKPLKAKPAKNEPPVKKVGPEHVAKVDISPKAQGATGLESEIDPASLNVETYSSPKGEPVGSSPTINPEVKPGAPRYEGKMEYGKKSAESAQDEVKPAPMPASKIDDLTDEERKTKKKRKSMLSAEQKAKLTSLHELDSDDDNPSLNRDTHKEQKESDLEKEDPEIIAERNRTNEMRKALITGGGMATVGPLRSIEAALPGDKHKLFKPYSVKIPYSFYESAKAYWKEWLERNRVDIASNASMAKVSPETKSVYERLLAAQKRATVSSGKLGQEARDVFDSTLSRLEAEGAASVDGRIDHQLALRVVDGLAQAISERGQIGRDDFLLSHLGHEAAYRFAHFMRSKAVVLPGLTGETKAPFEFKYRDYSEDGQVQMVTETDPAQIRENMVAQYNYILEHMASIGAISEKEATALSLDKNKLSAYSVFSEDTDTDTANAPLNLTRNALRNALGGAGLMEALIPGRALPVTTTVLVDGKYTTELEEALRLFDEVKHEDQALAALSDSEFLIGIIGMGQGRASHSTTTMDARLGMVYDSEKLPAEFMEKMQAAGFITIKKVVEDHKERWDYVVKDVFDGALAKIRKQTFMKDMDLESDPRAGFFSGKEVIASDGTMAEMRNIRPGSVLLDDQGGMAVVGPVRAAGRFQLYTPQQNAAGKRILKANPNMVLSMTQMAERGFIHVPRVWDMLQGHPVGVGFQAHNIYDWVNAESAVESRAALAETAAEVGQDLSEMGHGRIVHDMNGRAYLVLASAAGAQRTLEVVSGSGPAIPLHDAMLRVRTEIGASIAETLRGKQQLSTDDVKAIADRLHVTINSLAGRKQISMTERADLLETVLSVVKALVKSMDQINTDGGELSARALSAMYQSGFLTAEERDGFALYTEIMGATTEMADDSRSVDEVPEAQGDGSGFSLRDSSDTTADIDFSETLRDVLGLNSEKAPSFKELAETLESRAREAKARYEGMLKAGAKQEDVDKVRLEYMRLHFAIPAVKSMNLMLVTKAPDAVIAEGALKEARAVMQAASNEEIGATQAQLELAERQVLNADLPGRWIAAEDVRGADGNKIPWKQRMAGSAFYQLAPARVRSLLGKFLFRDHGNIKMLASMFRADGTFKLSTLERASHPSARPLLLHLLSVMSTTQELDGRGSSMLAANIAYYQALQKLPIKMKDGSSVMLRDLPEADRKLVESMLASGGVYAQMINAWRLARKVGNKWPDDPTSWPGNSDAMADKAARLKSDNSQSVLELASATLLPKSDTVDVEALALRLGTLDIPPDAGLMLKGASPEERMAVYEKRAFTRERVELFLQSSDDIYLRPTEFHNQLDDALANDRDSLEIDNVADPRWFSVEGVTYRILSEERLQEEADSNNGIEPNFEHGEITGTDYALLQHMREIFPSVFKFSGGGINRGGRASILNINGETYPIRYTDKTISPFGESLLQMFRAEHDRAWTDDTIPEYMRVRIREQMEAWEELGRQYGKTVVAESRKRGQYRKATSIKHVLSEARFTEDEAARVKAYLHKLANEFLVIPGEERVKIVIHGAAETADQLLATAAGRMLLPDATLVSLSAPGGAKQVKKDLRLTMGFIGRDGAIHIFPAHHADASGKINDMELARTLFHELVGHVALKKILGPEYEGFMLSVFAKHIDPDKKLSMTRDMKILEAEEYVARMAEQVSYDSAAARLTNPHIGGILDRIGAMIMRFFRKIMARYDKNIEISKIEIRELLERAFQGSQVKTSGYGFVGPAMIPGENLPGYDGFKSYTPNLADRFMRNITDRLRYWDMLYRSKERDSEAIRDDQNFMYGLRTLSSRIGFWTEKAGKLEQHFVNSFKGKSFDQATVNELVLALHTLERNEHDFARYIEELPAYLRKIGALDIDEADQAKGITAEDKLNKIIESRKRKWKKGEFASATGMTSNEANKILGAAHAAGLLTSRNGGKLSGQAADAVNAVLEASRWSLDVAEQAGMISHEDAQKFRDTYGFYVPIPSYGHSGFQEVNGFRLQGQSRFAADLDTGTLETSMQKPDILATTFGNLRQRIVEAELNKTNQYILEFARANPNAGVFTTYLHPEEVEWLKRTEDVQVYEGINDDEKFRAYASKRGLATMIDTSDAKVWTRERLREYEQQMGLVAVYENGRMRHIRIEHEGLRTSYQKFLNPRKMGWAMRQLGKVNRWLIGMNTMLNPEFMIPNLFRDAGASLNTLAIHGTVAGITDKTGVDFAKEFAPRIRHAMRAIYAVNFGKDTSSLTGEAALMAKYIEEFQESGGKIQWPFMGSAADTMQNFQKSINAIQGKGPLSAKAGAFADKMQDIMKRTADVFENATRLSAYVTARENGVSMQRAAMLSRDLTVDFDRRGEIGQIFNTLYLFANAGLQGTLVIARAIRNNPTRAMKHLSMFAAASFSLALANILMAGSGDDGEPNYFALPEETRNSNLVIMLPFNDGTPIKIPLPYGYAFFWSVGQEMANAIFGRGGAGKAAAGVLSSMLNNFNPLESAAGLGDSHGWTRLVMPTIADPFVDIAFEQTAFGTPLMPKKTFDEQPDSTRHWRSVSSTSKEATRLLNEVFGGSGGKSSGLTDVSPETLDLAYETVAGGLGKFLGRSVQLLMAPVSGRELTTNDLPILRRFLGGKLNWEDRGRFKDNYAEIQGANRTYKNLSDNVTMAQLPELKQQALRDKEDFYAENKHILNLRKVANSVVSRVGSIDKQKERLYKSGLPDSEISPKLKELDQKQRAIFSEFNQRYYEIVDLK